MKTRLVMPYTFQSYYSLIFNKHLLILCLVSWIFQSYYSLIFNEKCAFYDPCDKDFNPIIVLFLTQKMEFSRFSSFSFQSYYSLIFNNYNILCNIFNRLFQSYYSLIFNVTKSFNKLISVVISILL